ncbi:hypothetical protein Tco_1426984 [Tanacetum coccineum]
MASNGNDPDAEYALSRLLQRGTVAEYQKEFEMLISRVTGKYESLLASIYTFVLKPALIRALLWSNLTTLGEAFALACVAEAQLQDLEETTLPKSNKVEAVKTSMVATSEEHKQHEYQDDLNEIFEEKDDAKPQIFSDTFGSNGCNDSETSGPETPAKEVVNNGIENEGVVGFPEEFQEGDMVDTLSKQRSLGNWKELDNESKDWKVERDAKREGEPTILATFGSDRGITISDPGIKIVFKTPP